MIKEEDYWQIIYEFRPKIFESLEEFAEKTGIPAYQTMIDLANGYKKRGENDKR